MLLMVLLVLVVVLLLLVLLVRPQQPDQSRTSTCSTHDGVMKRQLMTEGLERPRRFLSRLLVLLW